MKRVPQAMIAWNTCLLSKMYYVVILICNKIEMLLSNSNMNTRIPVTEIQSESESPATKWKPKQP